MKTITVIYADDYTHEVEIDNVVHETVVNGNLVLTFDDQSTETIYNQHNNNDIVSCVIENGNKILPIYKTPETQWIGWLLLLIGALLMI